MNHRERVRCREKKCASDQFNNRSSQRRTSVEFRIDELVLRGTDFTRRERIADALQSELTNMITESGLPKDALPVSPRDRIDGGMISLQPNAAPERIGTDIGRAVYGSLSVAASKKT